VVGKLDISVEQPPILRHLPTVSLHLKQEEPDLKFPALDPSVSYAQNLGRWKQWRQQVLDYWLSDTGKAQRQAERTYEVPAKPDLTFRIDNVPAGTYELEINALWWSGKSGPGIKREVSIPQPTDRSPVDLGILK
jgi:hypothetical protein